ncbi:hypothetical protein [Nevskia ramosa]|uniref:hypothetical protein n=1 Tax=Nevskia ramosa TaxID=64002 RepID=UPI0023554C83|nr:hypothetical protein [Nevskia ramosa]
MSSTDQAVTSRMSPWIARLSSSFVFGLSIGVLIGFAVSAPLLGWHLPAEASAVLSAFFGGVAGVAGAVLIWRMQEQSQRQSIQHLVIIGLSTLKSAAENAATGYNEVPGPVATFLTIDTSLRAQLSAYADMWNGLGVHQSAFNFAVSIELASLKRHVDRLVHELKVFDERRASFLAPGEFNDVHARILVRSITASVDRAIAALQ